MENVNIQLAANIQKFRKKQGLTQTELAEKLGVTFQAVSKWENAQSMPDITLLPLLADIFDCHIDELFSREVKTEVHYDHCSEFPWHDDNIIRGVVCFGRKILQVTDGIVDKFTFEVIGDAKTVTSECGITVSGCVYGGCNAGDDITVGGHLSGGCNVGGDITCGGNFSGDINCGGSVKVTGDVEATKIKGNVRCSTLKCDRVEGDVMVVDGNSQ